MLKINKLMMIAAIGGVTLSMPAAAQDDGVPRAVVRYDDLNLANEAGRTRLDNRIRAAIRQMCFTEPRPTLGQRTLAYECQATAQHSADKQVAALFGGKGRQLAGQNVSIIIAR